MHKAGVFTKTAVGAWSAYILHSPLPRFCSERNILGFCQAMSLRRKCEPLFDCEKEEELKVVLKYKDKVLSSWDDGIVLVNFERKSKILDDYVKQLMESHDLDAIQEIKEMICGDPKLAVCLEPLVFERLVKILVEDNKESIKGSAACILAFANFDKCGVGIKEEATKVLVKLMSDDCDTISVPVLRTLTRLAYDSVDYACFVIENGALEGALAVSEPNFPSGKMIQNLAKFLVVVVRRVEVPSHKVGTVVTILDKLLKIRISDLRYVVRACYTLSYIAVERWVTEGNICKNLIDLIRHPDNMAAYSALTVVANIVQLGNSSQIQILTKEHNLLRCIGRSEICCKPKKFQENAFLIISNIAAKGRSSINDMYRAGLIDSLFKLLEADEIDVRMEAACTIRNVISGNNRIKKLACV